MAHLTLRYLRNVATWWLVMVSLPTVTICQQQTHCEEIHSSDTGAPISTDP